MSIISKILGMSAMRGLGLPHLPKLIQLGWSGNKALAWLKSKGVGYQRQIFQADWRQLLGIAKKKDTLKNIKKSAYGTATTIVMTDENMSAKYKLTYKVQAYDKEMKDFTEFHISIVSDRRMSMGQWDAIAEDLLQEEGSYAMYQNISYQRESYLEKRLV